MDRTHVVAPDAEVNPVDLLWLCLKLSTLGALLWLDRTHAFQVMISRPIVAAPFIGVLLGNPMDGLLVGVTVELLWTHHLPMGSATPPDETAFAILATSTGILGLETETALAHADLMYGFAVFLPVAYLYRRVDLRLKETNSRFSRQAEKALEARRLKMLARLNWGGLGLAYGSVFALLFVTSLAGLSFISATFPLLPHFLLKPLHFMAFLVPLVGVASVMSSARGFKDMAVLILAFGLFIYILR
ncbi:MAG: PTS sugar transporter subunit IIC [Deltaproteobacteria bacterium]|nr:PTS sugar transporter subunit IIC [Deltaproteobacteria bacterium]